MNDFNQLDNFFTGSPKDRDQKPPSRFFARIRDFFPSKEQFYYLPRVLSGHERLAIIALFVVMVCSLFAMPISAYYHRTTSVATEGGSWTEATTGGPQHINPLLLQANDVDSDLVQLLFAGLLRYDAKGNLVPELADHYEISDDGLQYTFVLKNNLKWHDGSTLTADDVVFTILTAQNGDYASTQRGNWQGVDVVKKDELTVVFKLKNRYAQFLSNATIGILPKHVWENVKSSSFSLYEINLKPIGAGPYKFSKIKKDSLGVIRGMDLIAFDKYVDGKPYIDRITFAFYDSEQAAIDAFKSGDAQGISSVAAEKLGSLSGSYQLHELQLPRYFAIFFNPNKNRPVSEKNVRIALNTATNKPALVQKILGGKGSIVDSPLLPGIIDLPAPTSTYAFDLEKAKSMLDAAGWKVGDDGLRTKTITIDKKQETVKMELTVTTTSFPELVAVANEIKTQWQQLGVSVNVKTLSVSEVQQAIKDRDYDALLFGEVLGLDPDPFSFWHSSQKRDPGLNLALYDNKDADKILEDTRQTLDAEQRKSKYDQLQNIIMGDAPAVFLYSPDYLYIQPKDIRGNEANVVAVPANRFDTIQTWYIDTKRTKK